MDIVARSLYSDREVFLRELISNASDALEKLRYVNAAGGAVADAAVPFEVRISTDAAKRTLTIEACGAGGST